MHKPRDHVPYRPVRPPNLKPYFLNPQPYPPHESNLKTLSDFTPTSNPERLYPNLKP
jgi:hypothetical protein